MRMCVDCGYVLQPHGGVSSVWSHAEVCLSQFVCHNHTEVCLNMSLG